MRFAMSCFLAFWSKDTKTIENLISNHAGIGNSGQDGALPGFCLCAAGEAGRLAQGKFNSREAGNLSRVTAALNTRADWEENKKKPDC